MKILHIAETAHGGVGTYIDQLVPMQSAALGRDAVRVIVPTEHIGPLGRIDPSQLTGFARPRRSLASLCNLARVVCPLMQEFKPDIVHIHGTFAGILIRLLYGWRPARPVLIYCPHGWAFNMQIAPAKQRMIALVERLLAWLCDHIIAISNFEAAEAGRIGIPAGQISMLYNAIPAVAPAPLPAPWAGECRKILFIGRLDRQKGFDLLAQAVNGLEGKISLRVAGAAVVDGAIAGRGDAANENQSNIDYLGWLSPAQIEGQLQQASLVVMPSRWEGFGLTALEAMRAGKPVIAASVGGLPEIVSAGINGRLVPANDVTALQTALLADDDETLAAMGQAGQRLFHRHFTLDRLHERLMKCYGEMMSRRKTSRSTLWPAPAARHISLNAHGTTNVTRRS